MQNDTKKFYCGEKEICYYKDHYINQRCFAPYSTRQSCPSIMRADNKTQAQGSKEEAVLVR